MAPPLRKPASAQVAPLCCLVLRLLAFVSYNERLLNPFSLLWIAAALGEDREVVARTRKDIDGYVSWRAKCGVVRRAIPWKRIYELALPLAEEERNRMQSAAG